MGKVSPASVLFRACERGSHKQLTEKSYHCPEEVQKILVEVLYLKNPDIVAQVLGGSKEEKKKPPAPCSKEVPAPDEAHTSAAESLSLTAQDALRRGSWGMPSSSRKGQPREVRCQSIFPNPPDVHWEVERVLLLGSSVVPERATTVKG